MADDKTAALIKRAQGLGLQLEYRSGFLTAAVPTSTDGRREELVEMEHAIIGQLGKRLEEVRVSVIAASRTARGDELVGNRVLIPIIGIGERTLEDGFGRVMRSQISGKLAACSEQGTLTVSYVETRDGERHEKTTTCAFDEAFIVVGSGDQTDRASSFASIRNEKIKRALERGQSIGLALALDAGFTVAKWNAAPGDQDFGEGILRELGQPRGELFSALEGMARGATGSDFVGRQVFVRAFDSFGVIRSCDLGGDLEVTYEDKHMGSSPTILTCTCSGSEALIIVEEAARNGSASPNSEAPAQNWLQRAIGGVRG
jgi:hypothetical protein